MIEKLQFYNTLTIVFLFAGIIFAVIAVIIFLKSGIKDYYMLTHQSFQKMHSGNTGNLKENKNIYKEDIPEERSVKTPSGVLNEEKQEEKEEKISAHIPALDKEDDGDGKTDDLGKENLYDEENEEESGLTGVLGEEALTGVLDQGFGPTSLLSAKNNMAVKAKIAENDQLWAEPLQNVEMTELHHIIAVHTDKKLSD